MVPAASTPMSRMDTSASASAARTDAEPRPTTSVSGHLPNFVIEIPRTQTSSPLTGGLLLSCRALSCRAWRR
jgi:hypothetical protein